MFFLGDAENYKKFTLEVAKRLNVGENDIIMVGSGRLGFSLNPSQVLKDFDRESDIDLVIIGSRQFDESWVELLSTSNAVESLEEEERRKMKKIEREFFKGYMRPDLLPSQSRLLRTWFPLLNTTFEIPQVRTRDVNCWLFKSKDHSIDFYSKNIDSIRQATKTQLRNMQ